MLYCFLPTELAAQGEGLNKIIFRTSFERKAFQDFVENPKDPDIFALMLAPDWEMDEGRSALYRAQFDSLADDYRVLRLSQLNDATKRDFLNNYVLYSTFSDVFNKQIYNCVSGTALITLYLHQFEIDSDVYWKPGHIYVKAYQDGSPFAFESTAVINGLAYADVLHSEIRSTKFSTERDSVVSIMALPAFQYQNEAIWAAQAQQYELALNCLRKASVLYPSAEIESSKAIFLYNSLSSQKKGLTGKHLVDYKQMVQLFDKYYEALETEQMIKEVASRFPRKLQRRLGAK